MRFCAIPLLLALSFGATHVLAAETTMTVQVRGRTFSMAQLAPSNKTSEVAVIFLPGDGGWRGAAVSMSRTISSWGYDVFGFDTKKYLETFSEGGRKLASEELAADVRLVANQVAGPSQRRVVLVGWSQGASMSVAAVSGIKSRSPIHGVVTLGLPESGVLGWDWKATLAIIARREPDQPTFPVKPLLPAASPVPVWMIHGTDDEYTTSEVARSLYEVTSEPKRLEEITGANHRFDAHQDELYRSLKKGLAWVAAN
jgi:dienelactone hydrolase